MNKVAITPPHVKGIITNEQYTIFVCDELQTTLPVRGPTDSNLFVSHCIPCYMKASNRCLGGTETIRRGGCSEYTRSEATKVFYLPVTLPPHFFIYCRDYPTEPRIYTPALTQDKEKDTVLEVLFLGNTYENGRVCLGGVTDHNDFDKYNPWNVYEFYFKGIRNEDLNVTSLKIKDYLNNYTIEKQREIIGSKSNRVLSDFTDPTVDVLLPPMSYSLHGRKAKNRIPVSTRYYIEVPTNG